MHKRLLATALLAIAGSAFAQAGFPTRPVTMVVPFPPGGGTDTGARLIAQKLTAKWGQQVVVENKGGAAGQIGADMVAKARPDGYTILMGNIGTQAINPALYAKLPDVPTLAEGAAPGFNSISWIGLLAPAATPRDVVEKISADVREINASEEVRNRLVELGGVPRANTPAQFAQMIDADRKRYTQIIRERKISVD